MLRICILLLSFSMLLTFGCRTQYLAKNMEKEINFVAEVRWVPLEVGFYGLLAEDGRKFLPLNLPERFRRDGLKVRVRGELKKNVVTIYMWGTPFEIHEIEVFSP